MAAGDRRADPYRADLTALSGGGSSESAGRSAQFCH